MNVARTDYEFCHEFEELIGCKECLHPSTIQLDSTCACSFSVSGVIPDKVCGCSAGLYTKLNGDCVSMYLFHIMRPNWRFRICISLGNIYFCVLRLH